MFSNTGISSRYKFSALYVFWYKIIFSLSKKRRMVFHDMKVFGNYEKDDEGYHSGSSNESENGSIDEKPGIVRISKYIKVERSSAGSYIKSSYKNSPLNGANVSNYEPIEDNIEAIKSHINCIRTKYYEKKSSKALQSRNRSSVKYQQANRDYIKAYQRFRYHFNTIQHSILA